MAAIAIIVASTATATAARPLGAPVATPLVIALASGSGRTVGPDGALYVTEGATGRVLRVNPTTGHVTTFASGLPAWLLGIGGAMDVACRTTGEREGPERPDLSDERRPPSPADRDLPGRPIRSRPTPRSQPGG